jgi:hypothetical protein
MNAFLRTTLFLASGLTVTACSSTPSVPMGTSTVATFTFDISREGDPAVAGNVPRFVFKPTAGGNPTAITAWVGLASGEGSEKALAVYDSADGDFDDDVTVPTPMPAGSLLFFDVAVGSVVTTGSIALK